MAHQRLCVFCKRFALDLGQPHYSELTPGTNAVIECTKGHWDMENYDEVETYRNYILLGGTCQDYDPVK